MMTHEEIIKEYEAAVAAHAVAAAAEIRGAEKSYELFKAGLDALRPVSREQVEKAWMGCKYCDEEWGTCDPITNRFTMPPRGGIRFCPMCGRPLMDEAVQMVMERMEAAHEEN